MGLFWRRKGRHALGAAVTAIPSGPLVAVPPPSLLTPASVLPPAPVAAAPVDPEPDRPAPAAASLAAPAPALPAPVAAAPAAPEPGAEPDLMGSIAALIASGEAWADPVAPPATPAQELAAPPAPAAPAESPAAAEQEPPAAPVAAPVRTSLESALAELLPGQGGAAAELPPAPARVQLGFRDGTSTTLDPDSTQSLALEQLAQSLTRGH